MSTTDERRPAGDRAAAQEVGETVLIVAPATCQLCEVVHVDIFGPVGHDAWAAFRERAALGPRR